MIYIMKNCYKNGVMEYILFNPKEKQQTAIQQTIKDITETKKDLNARMVRPINTYKWKWLWFKEVNLAEFFPLPF